MSDLKDKQAQMRSRQSLQRKIERQERQKLNPRKKRLKLEGDLRFHRVGELLQHILGQGMANEVAAELISLIRSPQTKPHLKLRAVEVLLDRAEGRPRQSVEVSQGITEADALRLFDLAERLGTGDSVGLPVQRVNSSRQKPN